MTLRVIFAGSPDFALPSLQCLVNGNAEIVAVITQPDRPKGRGRRLTPSPVKQFANSHGLRILQPHKFSSDLIEQVASLEPDVMIVVAFGLILPVDLLQLPKFGCINVHASLLPRWRGAAPVARAIEAGDAKTGITIMQMDAGLDTGPIVSQVQLPIEADATTASLQGRLATVGADELIHVLGSLPDQLSNAIPQDESFATYAVKLNISESRINWDLSALDIVRKIQAYNPWPVARTEYENTGLRIWSAGHYPYVNDSVEPGEVIESSKRSLIVGAGENAVRITSLQREGKNRMETANFLAGFPIRTGVILGSNSTVN